jgi:3-oxoacyl-[acyl-carrier-protein] synthase-3
VKKISGNKIAAAICGVGAYLPAQVLTSEELAQRLAIDAEWIRQRTGINERRIAAASQAASDLGAAAAAKALAQAGISADEVDLIIVTTTSGDMQTPSTACIIQERLGVKNIPAFDLAAACSGFIYALTVGAQFIANEFYRTILVIGVDMGSRVLNWSDRDTSILLADGAGAVLLRPARPGYGFLSMELRADGAGAKYMQVPAGGSRLPVTHEIIDAKLHKAHMNGHEIFTFAIKKIAEVTQQALASAGIPKEAVHLLIPNQANLRIIEAAARLLEFPMEKVMVNLDRYGNTGAASIPIALCEAVESGRIQPGHIVVLTGVGAGMAWGSLVMRWG